MRLKNSPLFEIHGAQLETGIFHVIQNHAFWKPSEKTGSLFTLSKNSCQNHPPERETLTSFRKSTASTKCKYRRLFSSEACAFVCAEGVWFPPRRFRRAAFPLFISSASKPLLRGISTCRSVGAAVVVLEHFSMKKREARSRQDWAAIT